jgi:hypothetical protein
MAKGYPMDEEFLAAVQSATNDWVGLVHTTSKKLSKTNVTE